MASPALALIDGAASPEVVDQIVLLPVDQIDASDRLRPIDRVWSAALGRIMTKDGQDDEIEVCRLPGRTDWRLIVGAHRLDGARLEGWTHIRAIVKSADALERRRREVSENLWRKALDPLDRAAFVAELHEVARARAGIAADVSGRTVSASMRWQKALKAEADDASATMALAYGFAEGVAEEVGLSRRSIYRDLQLFRRLNPEVAASLRGHSVGKHAGQLRALTALSDASQRQAAKLILDGKVKTVGAAIAMIENRPKPDAEAKRLNTVLSTMQRMGKAERKAALQLLIDTFGGALADA